MKSLPARGNPTETKTAVPAEATSDHVRASELMARYRRLKQDCKLGWRTQFDDLALIGKGGQGVVFRSSWHGADGFSKPVALKVFSPEIYFSPRDYEWDMARVARDAARVAEIQQDHLLDVHNFIEQDGIRVMLMEWIDGYDLKCLLGNGMLEEMREHVDRVRWNHLNDVVIAEGAKRSRLKPGIAIQILRECLMGLAALHRAGLAHGDIKPANIMLKRTGNVKLVDFGTTVDLVNPGMRIAWTPTYAAPEVLDGKPNTARSDLASLGYVFVEMLSGEVLFDSKSSIQQLLEAKHALPRRLGSILPADVLRDRELTELCRNIIEPDPTRRVGSAEEANLKWAANVHRRLVKTGLDSDYENDIRVWMEALPIEAIEAVDAEIDADTKKLAPAAAAGSDLLPAFLGDSTILV
jgi:serine/threonine-protein kinase